MTATVALTTTRPRWQTGVRVAGLAGLGVIALTVALSDMIARAPADRVNVRQVWLPPSAAFPFGTDIAGRDVLSETLHGLAVTSEQAVIAALTTLIVGALGGFLAARLRFRLGYGVRWTAGIFGAVTPLFLAILFIAVTNRGLAPLAAGVAAAPLAFARTFDRASGLASSRHAEFARATGIGALTLLRRDLVYEMRRSLLAIVGRGLASGTIILSTVSFFGFGALPPHRDLGLMIAGAFTTARASGNFSMWWTALFPALALALVILMARLAAGLEDGTRP